MLIAHLPAGFLLSERLSRGRPHRRRLLAAGMLASLLPDLDMIWFYTLGERAVEHHHYWTHVPLFWLGLGLPAVALARWRSPALAFGAALVLASLLLHLVLDTWLGGIAWKQPWSGELVRWSEVTPLVEGHLPYEIASLGGWSLSVHGWIWSTMHHPAFAAEIVLVLAALARWAALSRGRRSPE